MLMTGDVASPSRITIAHTYSLVWSKVYILVPFATNTQIWVFLCKCLCDNRATGFPRVRRVDNWGDDAVFVLKGTPLVVVNVIKSGANGYTLYEIRSIIPVIYSI